VCVQALHCRVANTSSWRCVSSFFPQKMQLADAREQNPQRRESNIREVIMLEKAMGMTPAEFRIYPNHMIITCTRGTRRAAAVRTIQIFSCQTCCNGFMIAEQRQAQEEQWWRRLHQEREEQRLRQLLQPFGQGFFLYSFSAPPLRETPAEVMAQLPSYPFQRISGAESVECAVCLEALQADDIARDLPCHHTFHRKCIDTWLSSNHTCPVCRQDLLKN
jgi:hypothetical protein